MASQDIKMTVRLPERLHAALRQRAQSRHRSMNGEMLDLLRRGLIADSEPVAERAAVAAVLREHGLWAPEVGWGTGTGPAGQPVARHAELRRAVGPVPPLSDLIIDERGPC
jgi:plasmid stability protein